MKQARRSNRKPGFAEVPFYRLIEHDEYLGELRRSYADLSAKVRRDAADFAYHAATANDLFSRMLPSFGQDHSSAPSWPAGIVALAIDPTFAPALLTVGSIEYQLGRAEDAIILFTAMLDLPSDSCELEAIIDKAGTFLLDCKDFDRAHRFYDAACRAFPEKAILFGALGYSLSKLGRHQDCLVALRRAVALSPSNSVLLSDLGWTLTENGQYEEAEQVLRRAVELSHETDDRARNNLEETKRRKVSSLASEIAVEEDLAEK